MRYKIGSSRFSRGLPTSLSTHRTKNLRFVRVVFQKKKEKRKILLNNASKIPPTDIFEGCTQWGKGKRDYVIMKTHRRVGVLYVDTTVLKIGPPHP